MKKNTNKEFDDEVNNDSIEKLDPRKPDELLSAFDLADNIITKRFLSLLSKFEIVKKREDSGKVSSDEIRLIAVKKIVYDKNENNVQKLTNVYSTIAGMNSDMAIIIDSNGKNVNMYIGVLGTDNLYENSKTMHGSIKANFPGSLGNYDSDVVDAIATQRLLNDIFHNNNGAIACVSGVASIRNDQLDDNINNIQGIERMIDAMQGHRYTAIFIANHLNDERLDDITAEYEMIYSKLAPFLKSDMSYNYSETDGISKSIGESLTDTVGTMRSTSLSIGTNESTAHSEGTATTKTDTIGGSYTHTAGNSQTHTTSHTKGKNAGIRINTKDIANLAVAGIGMVFPPAKPVVNIVGNIIGNVVDGVHLGKSVSDTISDSFATASSNSYSTNYSHSISRTNSITDTTTFGKSNTSTDTEGENNSTAKGSSKEEGKQHQEQSGRNLSISYENKTVSQLLNKIDEQLERIKQCRSYGVFATAAYFVSDSMMVSQMAASSYKSLISGKSTAVEKSCMNIWNDINSYNLISDYLKRLQHPIFNANDYFGLNIVTPASLVSGQELAIQMSLPQKSVTGVSVIESTTFGRNIFLLNEEGNKVNKKVNIGKIYHMGSEEQTEVNLDVESLSMHTFITGSTGSGKSNTIYHLLNGLRNQGIKFLVVEPAKGEYKNVFGGRDDVDVYGTNPKISNMLKINPFKFPPNTHVLEHIDRLIEVFNVCWPMYAAMPAILKEAVENAYIDSGWDLDTSENKNMISIFPNFKDLLYQLEKVINESAFSQEVKDNYTGALVTRVKSLTNGVNGRIFTGIEIGDELLFEKRNVIIDLSRIGSSETKSMIMGILILRLQEYRMENINNMNSPLKHVTVLEEAHNILKRTSTYQSSEGANLVGKSVEMISNIIAEIRTYGEGFIIADQSPGLLDLSVIRNTNTKIIMRVPEFSDRDLVGKSANLNDLQIAEIARLSQGVAAIYQNNWLEPILCKIPKFESVFNYEYKLSDNYYKAKNEKERIIKYLLSKIVKESKVESVDEIKRLILECNYNSRLKANLIKAVENGLKDKLDKEIVSLISNMCDTRNAFKAAYPYENDIEKWNNTLVKNIMSPNLLSLEQYYQDVILQCIIIDLSNKESQLRDLAPKWVEFMRKGRMW